MREIKFRAWDKMNNRMSDGFDISELFIYNENWNGGRIYFHPNDFVPQMDCDLMQFTGLKDRNGKEVYEGDICELKLGDLFVGSFKAKVIFEEGAFAVTPLGNETDIFGNKYSGKPLSFYPGKSQ